MDSRIQNKAELLADDLHLLQHIRNFLSRIENHRNALQFILFCAGVYTTGLIAFFPISVITGPLLSILHLYLLFRLLKTVNNNFPPPHELLVVGYFLVFLLEHALIQFIYADRQLLVDNAGWLLRFAHTLVLNSLIVLLASMVFQNDRGKVGGLLLLLLIAFLVITPLRAEQPLQRFLIQCILFLFSLRRTRWLEQLSKTECWLYWLALLFLFVRHSDFYLFEGLREPPSTESDIWHGYPRFLYYAFKMYLLALLVKIPIVLVYNFATLSRKLRISSMFLSTFPQIVQLILLFIVFYFFLAGWQAEKVRVTIEQEINKLRNERTEADVTAFRYNVAENRYDTYQNGRWQSYPGNIFVMNGYEPPKIDRTFPENGLVTLRPQPSLLFQEKMAGYFLFRSMEDEDGYVYFLQLDSRTMKEIALNIAVLAGTEIRSYEYPPPRIERLFLDLSFFDSESFRIMPFSLMAPTKRYGFRESIGPAAGDENESRADSGDFHFVVGRVLAPMYDSEMHRSGYWAFDILLAPQAQFFTPTIISYLLLLGVAYFLLNSLIVRRMVQFGSEINKTIIEKFAQLKQGIRQISTGNLNYKVQLEGRDEFVELAGHFNEMGDRLKDAIEKEREKERLQHELAIARQVQLGLLPKELPKIPDFEIAANLETANEVGGDFYDIAEAGDGKYLITIGDVSGKGTSAAFYMAQCICLIRFSMQFTREPAEIAVRLNEYFAGPTVDKEVFVTAIIGLLDSKSGKFQFVRAGHTMPFYLPADKSKKINEIKSTGLGIGLAKKNSFMKRVLKPKEIEFRRGDSVILCTDGLLEAARPGPAWDDEDNGKVVTFYGEERFKALLENSRDLSPAAILETVQNDIETFYGGAPRVDDYTLIILRRD